MNFSYKRPFYKTLTYYLFRILGPCFLIFGVIFIAVIVWILSIFQFNRFFPVISPIAFVFSLIPLCMYIYSVIFTIVGDVGETKKAIMNPKYKRLLTNEFLSSLPVCKRCGLPKPERCHHCSFCNKCHLRMDHHCPAVGVCISVKNTQSFIVMLRWAVVLIIINLLELVASYFYFPSLHAYDLTMIGLLSLLGFTVAFFLADCMKRVVRNMTTLEQKAGERNKYDLGKEENIRQIFGKGKLRMWIPHKNTLTGFEWSLPDYQQGTLLESNRFDSVDYQFPNQI